MNDICAYKRLTVAIIKAAVKSRMDNLRFWKAIYTVVKNYSNANCEITEDGVSAQVYDIKVTVKDGEDIWPE